MDKETLQKELKQAIVIIFLLGAVAALLVGGTVLLWPIVF